MIDDGVSEFSPSSQKLSEVGNLNSRKHVFSNAIDDVLQMWKPDRDVQFKL